MSYKVRVEPQAANFASVLGLQYRRELKRAILGLAEERGDIRALTDELTGYYRLRVGRFRVIFKYRPAGAIQCVFAEERKLVYDLFESEMLRFLEQREPSD